jgi:hypothetical protein
LTSGTLRLITCPNVEEQRRLPSKLVFVAVLVTQIHNLVLPLRPSPKVCLVNLKEYVRI